MMRVVLLAAVLAVAATAANADSADGTRANAPTGCAVSPNLMTIEPGLLRGAARILQREPIKIVALGSSSTEGFGATTPESSYPSRLQVALKERFRDVNIRVVNRGKGGEEVPQMLRRLGRDVIAEQPDLVIWQLGTNAVLHKDDVTDEEAFIDRGIARVKESGSDIVLMDIQYARRVLARPAYAKMEQIIANVAKRARVGLFRRFEIMRQWQAAPQTGAPMMMVGPDGLHMTDWGYNCLAADLADALAWNWWSHRPRPNGLDTARVAGLVDRGHTSAQVVSHAR